jgi:acetyl-CoA acetyltransferase
MLLRAVLAACADGGIDPRELDGFASYADGHDEGPTLASALAIRDFRFSVIASGGGGGLAGAIAAAAAAIHSGLARTVLVYRALAQAESGRQEFVRYHFTSTYRAQGVVSAVQSGALKTQRMFEHDRVPESAKEAFVLATYHHAQTNPDAMAYGRPLDSERYRNSRLISDPHRVYDCSRESDGAFAMILTSAERAAELIERPAYLLAIGQSGYGEDAGNRDPYVTSSLKGAARRLWEQSGLGPADVDVAQVYENTSGPAVLSLIDHGFCTLESAGEFLTFENLTAPSGALPVNTAGGNLAAGFVHGMGLPLEAVRQIRGESCNQVPDAKVSLLIAGPQAQITGSALFVSEDALS